MHALQKQPGRIFFSNSFKFNFCNGIFDNDARAEHVDHDGDKANERNSLQLPPHAQSHTR